MYISELRIENFRMFGEGEHALVVPLRPGLTAIVGENDAGKTAVIDALRFALGTTDQDWYRLEDTDFHKCDTQKEIRIVCTFTDLSLQDMSAFAEYLTYGDSEKDPPILCVNWLAIDTGAAPKGRPFRRVEMRSGRGGDGPRLAPEVREMLRATYLRPLRDAEFALSAGRGSRLSQVLQRTEDVRNGQEYDPDLEFDPDALNVRGIGDYANALLQKQQGISATRSRIDDHLAKLSLHGDELKSSIKVSGTNASDENRLRQLLEKLDLSLEFASKLTSGGKLGLGSNNLLFMACELLLLAQEDGGNKLLLIEEPEAHLHSQRQLQVMKYLQKQAEENQVQIIVTTHSPNLASAISLENIVMVQGGHAFSLAKGETKLRPSDYRFLERFLDVTKANLFFARGVMVVEGDAESILLPTLARVMGRDFTEYGVSIVNVGGVGLRRYARIFQRGDVSVGELGVPVACVTDMDVMPNCAPAIVGKVKGGEGLPDQSDRRWRVESDFCDANERLAFRESIKEKASGQGVTTFVADKWTFEYDLAYYGLAEEVYVAASLAKRDEALAREGRELDETDARNAKEAFENLQREVKEEGAKDKLPGASEQELLATKVYALFTTGAKASKTISAQYLAGLLEHRTCTEAEWREALPSYLVQAIEYVTGTVNARPKGMGEK